MPPPLIALLLAAAVALSAAAPAGAAAPRPDGETVRVRLFERERPAAVTLRAVDAPADLLVDGRLLLTLAPGGTATVETDGGRVVARAYSAVERGSAVSLRPHAAGARVLVGAGGVSRHYRGALEAAADGRAARSPLRLVNEVVMEDYIASVVPSEYPFQEIEGVKAQAVLVRTYALKSRGKYDGYDLVDHVGSQVYRGADAETPTARRAAEATRGEVLTYRGGLIEAVYSSSSGGHTTDNEGVWSSRPLPYLRGRPDPYDSASPNYRWTEAVERDRLLRALSRRYGFQVTGISVASTSPEGRATAIRLHGARATTEQANRFRLTVNELLGRHVLKSTFFTLSQQGNRYVFAGRGFGHGVGMSQYGAREQARQGRDYRDILAFYFSGVTLERAGALGAPREPLMADRPEWRPEWPDMERGGADVLPTERIEPRPTRPVATEDTRTRITRTGW